jgi:ribosome-interacting GTPase 1
MPTNLPPEYFGVEKQFRAAKSIEEKISCLEELLTTIPKHKGTDKLRADLRRRLSKLKSTSQAKKKIGRHESIYQIDKEGAARVVVLGPPNVGKSALVSALTNATPKVSEYPYTTWTPSPGMMPVDNIQIQLIDTPPLTRNHVDPELLDLIRNSDLILLVVDLQTYPIQQLEDTITILHENRISLRYQKNSTDQERMTFIPLIVIVNKNDNEILDEDFQVFCELFEGEWSLISISTKTGHNLKLLKQAVLDKLEIIRIYSKSPGKEPDLSSPFVLKKGSTITEFAEKVHKDFLKNLKIARVWGSSVYDGQMVGRDHMLQDGDVVELHI